MRSSVALLLVAASFFRSSLAIRETYQYLDDKSTNSWDHLHFEDPYYQRTGAYYAGLLYVNYGRIYESYQRDSYDPPATSGSEPVCKADMITPSGSEDSEESEDEGKALPNQQIMTAIGWVGPPAAGSNEKNPVQAWIAGWPGSIHDVLDHTIEGGKEAAAITVAAVKENIKSTNARVFPYEFDTSVYAWNKSSKSPVPESITELYSIDPKSIAISHDDTYLAEDQMVGQPMLSWNYDQNPDAKPAFDSQGNAQLAGNPWSNHNYFNSTCGGRLFTGLNTELQNVYPDHRSVQVYGHYMEIGQNVMSMKSLHRVFYNSTAGQDFLAQFDKLAGDTKESTWYKNRADASKFKDKPDAYIDIEVWFLAAFDEEASTNRLIVPTNENATAELVWEKLNDKSKTATKAPTTKNSVPAVDGGASSDESSSSVGKQLCGGLLGISAMGVVLFSML
ncbi:hypothetical protein BJ508DRAFT_410877 [Ascobolus immersus RN42]|uniref:Uncharacterized protein n=1 Tax=Ascobolus immersus RN42 TaxID=1160509 RepID=A0A3N4IRJ8_ASCIM|nr:hypothetical protein BJ508DRAFT_410877 [Ascobolus immersus RN42]